jgi:hypothetical protein
MALSRPRLAVTGNCSGSTSESTRCTTVTGMRSDTGSRAAAPFLAILVRLGRHAPHSAISGPVEPGSRRAELVELEPLVGEARRSLRDPFKAELAFVEPRSSPEVIGIGSADAFPGTSVPRRSLWRHRPGSVGQSALRLPARDYAHQSGAQIEGNPAP